MIVGVDEVGRGPWAGPVTAAAVLLEHNFTVSKVSTWKLDDSKALSALQRQKSAGQIRRFAASIGIGWVSPAEIDSIGLGKAVGLAMRRAVFQLGPISAEIIIDGAFNYLPDLPARAVIKADSSVPAVSAASIIAKVARDRFMQLAAQRFPGYGFESHVGYGNSLHRAAIEKLGLTPLHRRSFHPVLQKRLF